jgi:hypothetical protein
MTGVCEIDVDKAIKCFGKQGFIVRYRDEYRLVNNRAKVKITIDKQDALCIIEQLQLIEQTDFIFKHTSIFRKGEQ